jgi:predicted ATPase
MVYVSQGYLESRHSNVVMEGRPGNAASSLGLNTQRRGWAVLPSSCTTVVANRPSAGRPMAGPAGVLQHRPQIGTQANLRARLVRSSAALASTLSDARCTGRW